MPVLDKRIYYYSSGSSWTWGRWILFALLIVGLAALIFGTNVRRRRRGAQPIVGTSWLAPPPSYGQAAAQNNNYNPNNPQMSQQPLPLYTENVNQNDMGYYDSEGKFIPTSPQNAYYEGFPLSEQQQQQQQQHAASTTGVAPGNPGSSTSTTPVVHDDRTGESQDIYVERPEPAITSQPKV